ncbi:MAG: polyprenyl synthetase family protein [Sulfolobales archaeon]|nr:polyprenyl synthetase family protein [Sulfolobales archaeon]MDW8010839.1 polyprenyl synthetase family protein [Sulfolobales archaeon]
MELPESVISFANAVSSLTYRRIVELVGGKPVELYDASIHLIRAGGKRLRPLLVVLSSKMYGLSPEISSWAAAAVEIFHNFTLVHDDIIDRDEFRRGVPTVHKIWGEALAIVAGDLLFAKSYEALLKLVDYGLSYERVVSAIRELTWAAVTVAEGQAMDLLLASRDRVSVEEYIEMVGKKTAALFRSSVLIGAAIAGAQEDDLARLREFAMNVGIAFQIRDDELGLVADERTLGKPKYSDLREGKKTILVLYALERASDSQRKTILSALGRPDATRDELEKAASTIIELGALEFSNRLAEDFVRRSVESLYLTNPTDVEARDMLRELAYYVTRRSY